MNSLIKKPSAWIPVAMSFAALAILLAYLIIFVVTHGPNAGIVRETDEGTGAHLFQILMAGQMPVILFFAAKWLPRSPWQALRVLAIQFFAIVAAFFPIFLFKL